MPVTPNRKAVKKKAAKKKSVAKTSKRKTPTKKAAPRKKSATKKKAAPPESSVLLNKKQFAETIGIGARQVDNLVIDGMPKTRKGRLNYYPLAAITWYFQRKLEKEIRIPDYQEARARREKALAEMAEIELEKLRGSLMTVEQFETTLELAFTRVRIKLENTPPRLADVVTGTASPNEAIDQIVPIIDEIIEELQTAEDVPEEEAA